jgi:hypothetical protein
MTPRAICHLMWANRLSSGQIAAALGIGRSQVSRWRTGERPIPQYYLQPLEEIFAGRRAVPESPQAGAWNARRHELAARLAQRKRRSGRRQVWGPARIRIVDPAAIAAPRVRTKPERKHKKGTVADLLSMIPALRPMPARPSRSSQAIPASPGQQPHVPRLPYAEPAQPRSGPMVSFVVCAWVGPEGRCSGQTAPTMLYCAQHMVLAQINGWATRRD